MKVAALDLGSNTSLLLIADVEGGQIKRVIHDETRVTKLGQGVHTQRKFHPEALERMRACLTEYSAVIKVMGCENVVAVATSAARDVSNGHELIEMGQRLAIPIHIISGEREAQLTFRGALCDRSTTERIAVIDVGGGSTEIISESEGVARGTSVDVGSVRLTELFVKNHPVPADQRARVRDYVQNAFKKAPLPQGPFNEVVAVAGTPTTLAAVEQAIEFDERRVHGYKLSLPIIESWIERLSQMTIEQREALPGMQPKRADVIVTGAEILAEAIRTLGRLEVTVSTRGVRYGVALAWQDFLRGER